MSAMDRVRAEQARRAEALKLLEEWEAACVHARGDNAKEAPMTAIARLIVAGDQLASALACTVPWYLDKENDSE